MSFRETSQVARARIGACLDALREYWPCRYAQWVEEDPRTRDFSVVASRSPEGAQSYEVAHRTGVIGQVFRRRRPIWLPDARTHPLYDLYDPEVRWELTVPCWRGLDLIGVLNLEGDASVELSAGEQGSRSWVSLVELIEEEMSCEVRSEELRAGESWFVTSTRATVPCQDGRSGVMAALDLGRFLAQAGRCGVVVGSLPVPARRGMPTLAEARREDVPRGGCFRGFERGLDLLPTGFSSGEEEVGWKDWWPLVDGRYDFVLIEG